MTEAEIRGRQLQAEEHRGLPATTDAARGRKDCPPRHHKGLQKEQGHAEALVSDL